MKIIGPKLLLCGQERGYLSVIDLTKYAKIGDGGKVEHKDDKSHINAITKTATKGLYVLATNKGISIMRINEKNQNIMI